jgi:hypothetical protein
VVAIAEFFKTGRPPVAPEETIELYAFLEAAERSRQQGGKPVSVADVLQEAGAEPPNPSGGNRHAVHAQ